MDGSSWEPGGLSHGGEAEASGGEQTVSAMMSVDGFTFDTLIGYDEEIARIRDLGILEGPDPEFVRFIEQMQQQHGLYNEPSGDFVLLHSSAREDADRLMLAVANELDRPTIRMRLVSGPDGRQALCIMTTQSVGLEGFKDWGTLVLEGVDTWGAPDAPNMDLPYGEMLSSGMPNAAFKAISLIRSAISNPKVTVLASAYTEYMEASPMLKTLGHIRAFQVPLPSDAERDAIWDFLMDKHVSMSALDRVELVSLSRGMPRGDIFSAAREAVTRAYNESIERRRYIPVSRGNLLDKIAAYQPLESDEYRQIEDSAVEDLLGEIERYERGEL